MNSADLNPAGINPAGINLVACVKWAELRPEIDPLHGSVEASQRSSGFSSSDFAAVESALRLAQAWSDHGQACGVTVLCAGPEDAEDSLRDFFAVGATRVVRLDLAEQRSSAQVAELLASALVPSQLNAQFVICGDVSSDRGSGSVPAYLAHHLGMQQALGLIGLESTDPGSLHATRRLDGGRRERLLLTTEAVISVEGSVATLRRSSLAATLAAKQKTVELRKQQIDWPTEVNRLRPWRPRARVLAPPEGDDALSRILELTGAQSGSTAARTLKLDPEQAAEAVLEQLAAWGYLDDSPPA